MQTKQLHIIQKELIEITLPDFKAVQNWDVNDRQSFVEDVRKVIDRTFSEYEVENSYLLLEKLEIDLGTFKKADVHTQMPDRLYIELQKALAPYLIESGKSMPVNSNHSEWENDQNDDENFRLLTGSRGRLESLLFFLRTGNLPWWAAGLADWDEVWLQQLTSDEWIIIKQFFTTNDDNPVLRLITQVSDEFLATLVKGINGTEKIIDAWQWLLQLMKDLKKGYFAVSEKSAESPPEISSLPDYVKKTLPSIQLLRQRFWSQWINHILGKDMIPGLHYLLGENREIIAAIQELIQKKNSSVPVNNIPGFWKEELDQFNSMFDQQDKSAITEEPSNEIETTLASGSSPDSKVTGLSKEEPDQFNSNADQQDNPAFTGEPENENKTVLASGSSAKNKLNVRKTQIVKPGEKVFITSAGLVLLHPFLPQLFRNCGLLKEQHFKDANAQTTAIYLLNYLATRETETPEHKLLLPKILCGLLWEEPLEPVEPPDEILQAAGEELLVEVIKHWTALRNTSPGGLREAFLKRSGRLEFRDDGWQLLVEEKTQDVLLGRLPWGISIIKYPWMTGMLSVTWT
jgi:hypothetical protein